MELQVGRDLSHHALGELGLDRLEDDERVARADEELDVSALVEHAESYQLSDLWKAPAAPALNGIAPRTLGMP